MNWKPRVYWALLALLVAFAGWRLTILVTHVDRNASSTVDVVYDEEPHARPSIANLTLSSLQRERFRIPGIVISGTEHAALIITAATRSFTITNMSPRGLSCTFSDRIFRGASSAAMVESSRTQKMQSLPVSEPASGGSMVAVPSTLHEALLRAGSESQGMIVCGSSRQFAAAPTFTDRSLTLHVRGLKGVFVLDVSALEDIDNLRFSGGFSFPLAGERTRFLDGTDNLVSVEWVDVSASEQRDIILVTVGALAAISAAMAIEAIRPFIERSRLEGEE